MRALISTAKPAKRSSALLTVAVASIAACSAFAANMARAQDVTGAELQALRSQIEVLSAKLKELEARAVPAPASAAVVTKADVLPPATVAPAANRLSFAGEVRMRAESIDEEGLERRDRDRIRARAGVVAQLAPGATAGARISTGGRDPRATNATLTGEGSKKDVTMDLAYVRWKNEGGMEMVAGKMEDRTWRPKQSLLTSADVFPEGWSASYGKESGLFGSMQRFWLEERAADSDSSQYTAQLGYRLPLAGKQRLTMALGYSDFRDVQNRKPFFDGTNAYGNTTLADGTLANDFDVVSLGMQFDTHVGLLPLSTFAEFARNTAADEFDTAATLGAAFGDHTQPRGWQVAYQYEWLEKDAMFAQFVNADFGGGNTDSRGHVVKFGYGFAKNWSATLTFMLNDINVDVGQQHSLNRAQLDLLAKY